MTGWRDLVRRRGVEIACVLFTPLAALYVWDCSSILRHAGL